MGSGILLDSNGKTILKNGKAIYYHDYLRFTSDNLTVAERCTCTYVTNGVTVSATSNYGRAGFIFPVESGKRYTVEFDSVVVDGYKKVYFDNVARYAGDGWDPAYGTIEVGGHKTYTFTASTTTLFIGIYASANTTMGSITITNATLKET